MIKIPFQKPQRLRLLFIIAILLIATLLMMWLNMFIKKATLAQKAAGQPDIFVEDFRYYKLKPNGPAQYEVIGKKMTHYPQDDSYLVHEPVIYSLSKTDQLQTISSREAYIEDLNTKVHLTGHVVMTREPNANHRPYMVASNYMLLYPDEEKMITDQEVIIQNDRSVLSGVGLDANRAQGEMTVKSRVNVTYHPPGTQMPLKVPSPTNIEESAPEGTTK